MRQQDTGMATNEGNDGVCSRYAASSSIA
jgi:hypothetical protein